MQPLNRSANSPFWIAPCQFLGDCFRPYRTFLSLLTKDRPLSARSLKPTGFLTCTSSSIFLCRNSACTLSSDGQYDAYMWDATHCGLCAPKICYCNLRENLAPKIVTLYRPFGFTSNTHMEPISLRPFGAGTNS